MHASIKKALAAYRLQRGWPRCWLFTIAFLLMSVPCGQSMAATVAIACGAVGIELELCRQGAEAWAAHTGHKVRIISTPNDANERLALFQQLLAARSPDIDVFQIDVVWPGILAPYLLDLRPHVTAEETVRAFSSSHRKQQRQRATCGLAVVRRCRRALLPAGPAGEIWSRRAGYLATADGDSPQDSGRRASQGARAHVGLRLAGPRL